MNFKTLMHLIKYAQWMTNFNALLALFKELIFGKRFIMVIITTASFE